VSWDRDKRGVGEQQVVLHEPLRQHDGMILQPDPGRELPRPLGSDIGVITRCTLPDVVSESAEQQLAGEQKLYDVGRSTTFLLLQRQTELTTARTNELQAETDYSKALADLQRATAATLRVNNVVVQNPVQQP